ncbi:MAG: excinuclease ABC subunit UvrA [Thermoflexales bacterium]|nr:excinuclease ABC subunit UvrA [Thermoflexales bacterium]
MNNHSPQQKSETFELVPVGYVQRSARKTYLDISKPYVPALKQLEHFSHAQVLWWFSEFDGDDYRQVTQTEHAPYDAPVLGVFACRSPVRPNPIALTTVRIEHVDHKAGRIQIASIDAYDGTPVLDLKAHMPIEDRVKELKLPAWMDGWPEWMPEEGLSLEGQSGHASQSEAIEVFPLGHVRQHDGRAWLHILPPFAPALKQLEHFDHVRVLCWFHRFQDERFRKCTQNTPPYENAPVTGVFASRSPVRPNPIGLSTAKIISVDHAEGLVELGGLDAYDGTPVLDLKAYIPASDRVKNFYVPKWIAHWPEWWQDVEASASIDPDTLRPSDSERLAARQIASASRKNSPLGQAEGHDDAPVPPADPDSIVIRGARQHNLKNVDVTLPRGKLTVVTGVSGSGKSSLAFDTLYAEGQRRYLESLSPLARRLVGQMEKPKVDHVLGLGPTLAIEQRVVVRNPRSTVGTLTDVYDYLRVLFARAGTRHCPRCGRAIQAQTPRQMAKQLANLPGGTRIQLMVPATRLVIDQLVVPAGRPPAAFHKRLLDSVEKALQASGGYLAVALDDEPQDILLSQHTACPHCQLVFFELHPTLFSFNSPDGACSDCGGLGVKLDVDPELIVTQPQLSLLDGASSWWGKLREFRQNPTGNWVRGEVLALADAWNVDLEQPWNELPERFRQAALYGAGEEVFHFSYRSPRGRTGEIIRPVKGAVTNANYYIHQTTSENLRRQLIRQYMREQPCPTCRGERLCPEARFVTVGGARFPQVAAMTIAQAHRWIDELPQHLSPAQAEVAGEIIQELRARLQFMLNVGLHYLALDRPAPTLSGGEGQRIRLASQLGCGLMGLCYVLDEPSIGLHPRDHRPLLEAMLQLRDAGNTIVVVEHDADTMRAADWLIDLGPGAGLLGGQVVAAGAPADVMANPASLTGRYLGGELQVASPNGAQRREARGWLTVVGARLHNLKNIDVRFPLGLLTCVTGVSGSGKSSLVAQTLSPALARALDGSQDTAGPHERIEELDQIDKVISITQAPIGRTPRSNPSTYVGVFDEIRKLFARTPEAKAKRYKAAHFSFNDKLGRCEACQGNGRQQVEMHFLPDVWVTCPECEGRRFNPETLGILYQGKSIADVLDVDAREALEFFAGHPKITRLLQTLCDVGLDYIKLGQSALTLSGGEAQRVKLAKELGRADTGRTLYILDEPTTGLHFADIQKLLNVLHRLSEVGNTVIVIEHNLDVIKAADWIVDLGPGGGDEGGYLVAQGRPEEVARLAESYTGQFLHRYF